MKPPMWSGTILVAAALAVPPAAARQDVAMKEINPENVLKFQPTQPAAHRYTFDAADRYVQFGVGRHMQVVGHNLVWHSQTAPAFDAVVDALRNAR